MGFGPQVFVHALRQPDRDNTGRFAFGVGRVLLLAELDQPFLDLVELWAFLERGQVFQAGELTADDAIDTQNLAEERYPVRLRFEELAGRLQNGLVLLRRLGKHGDCLLPGRAEYGEAKRPVWTRWPTVRGRYVVAF